MRWPFKGEYRETQPFGVNPEAYAAYGLKGHNGVDHAVPCRTELYAMITGTVIEAQSDPNGYGNYVKIENDVEGALVGHLSYLKCAVGDKVTEGETIIGLSGTTGNSTGCHTHTGYFRKPRDRSNGYSGYIDPKPYISTTPTNNPQDTHNPAECQRIQDELRLARDTNWNLYQDSKKLAEELQRDLDAKKKENEELWNAIKNYAATLGVTASTEIIAGELVKLVSVDDEYMKLIDEYKELEKIIKATETEKEGLLKTVADKDAQIKDCNDKITKCLEQKVLDDKKIKELTTALEKAKRPCEKLSRKELLAILFKKVFSKGGTA